MGFIGIDDCVNNPETGWTGREGSRGSGSTGQNPFSLKCNPTWREASHYPDTDFGSTWPGERP